MYGLFVHLHVIAVSIDQLVAHGHDVVDGQLRAGVGVEHDGLVDVIPLQRAGGLDGQQLHVDICAVQRRALLRQVADPGGLHAVPVHQMILMAEDALGRLVLLQPEDKTMPGAMIG